MRKNGNFSNQEIELIHEEHTNFSQTFDNNSILLVDHDLEFVTEMKDTLEAKEFHAFIALNIQKGIELFYAIKPDFVLVNIEIEQGSLKERETFIELINQSHTPLVLVNEDITLEQRVYAYEIGATDVMDKNIIHLDWFVPYLYNRLNQQQRILIDELTGAYNRKYMERLLNVMIANYKRNQDIFSVVMIDLDYFKKVNDTYGHLMGDRVLKTLVKTINELKRETDYLCRFGGEEFKLTLPQTNAEEAMIVVERIREAFSKIPFKTEDEELFYVTFSAGITEIKSSVQSKMSLLNEADEALYQSKEKGRNQTTIYTTKRKAKIQHRTHIIIVDDNRLMRTMLEKSFKNWDFDPSVETVVHTFDDGVQFLATDWYQPQDKYIIILDGIMPRMNGIEVLRKIREVYPEEDVVVSMLSARTNEESIVKALENGADDYILKPFKIPEVLARIGRLARRLLF